jgi:hypothetical protein
VKYYSSTSVEKRIHFRDWNPGRESKRALIENEAEWYGIRKKEAHAGREGEELKDKIK